jgi:hypothetical protein
MADPARQQKHVAVSNRNVASGQRPSYRVLGPAGWVRASGAFPPDEGSGPA